MKVLRIFLFSFSVTSAGVAIILGVFTDNDSVKIFWKVLAYSALFALLSIAVPKEDGEK